MDTKIEFLYLSEPDTEAAGVNDASRCVEVAEEVFRLLTQGDRRAVPTTTATASASSSPRETRFPDTSVAGPDRRFFAMPAYLGGRFDCCGQKRDDSNAANARKGLPRSILTVMLNDKDTGAPLCLMSANLLSAARTGAVPGVGVRYLAPRDAGTLAVVGCGPINKACMVHILTQAKGVRKVVCYDLFPDKAQALAGWVARTCGLEGTACTDLANPQGRRPGDHRGVPAQAPGTGGRLAEPGALVMLTGPAFGDRAFWTRNRIILDHIELHEAYVEEAVASGDKEAYYRSVIGGPVYRLIDEGVLPGLKDFTSIGQVILGEKPGRRSDQEKIIFIACGMAVFDVGLAYEVYRTALSNNIGQKLLLWNEPAIG